MQAWPPRPLDQVYAAVFIDAIQVKIRDGQVANRPIYAALGVTPAGEQDILGLWAGEHGEARAPSSGSASSPSSRTAASATSSSWSATGSKGSLTRWITVMGEDRGADLHRHYADLRVMPTSRRELQVAA